MEKLLRYYKNTLSASLNMKFDEINDKLNFSIFELENGKLNEKEVKKLFNIINEVANRGRKDKEEIDINEWDIKISPFDFFYKIIHEHSQSISRRIDSDEKTLPFIIPAKINKDGYLSVSDKEYPFFIREVLEPIEKVESDIILGEIKMSDEFLNENKRKFDNWNEYFSFVKKYFEYVSKNSFENPKYEKYRVDKTIRISITPKIDPTKAIFELYDYLLDKNNNKTELKLLEKITNRNYSELKEIILIDNYVEILKKSKEHLGHMNREYGLAESQREAFSNFLNSKEGDVFALNGPPGTGKTTFLQTVIADYVVKSVVNKLEYPYLLNANSTNNQAVTNILDSLANVTQLTENDKKQLIEKNIDANKEENMRKRWLLEVKSLGIYFANKSSVYEICDSFKLLIPNKSNMEYIEKAQKYYCECYKEYFCEELEILENGIDKLYEKVIEMKNDIGKILDNEINDIDLKEKLLVSKKNLEEINNKYDTLELMNELEKNYNLLKQKEEILEKIEFLNSKVLEEIKNENIFNAIATKMFPFLKRKIIQRRKIIFIEYNHKIEDYTNIEKLSEIISNEYKDNKKEKENIEDRIKNEENIIYSKKEIDNKIQKIENEIEKNINELNRIKEKYDFSEKLPLLDNVDSKIRTKAFYYSLHYWELMYIIKMKECLEKDIFYNSNKEGKKSIKRDKESIKLRHKLISMVYPCSVNTFYMTPKYFSYYESKKNNPFFEIIDLMIVDEAGQVLNEVSVPSFSLAKKALVVGDVLQIEPVYTVTKNICIGNLVENNLLANNDDEKGFEELLEKGIVASECSLMQLSQKSSNFKLPDLNYRGLILREHRRCQKEIMNYFNELVYSGKLICKTPVDKEELFPKIGYAHIKGISSKISGSRANEIEAITIANWIKDNKDEMEKFYKKKIEEIIGIITPFKSQKILIESELNSIGINSGSIKVGTVHALQGAERDVIIFSTVYTLQDGTKNYFFDSDKNMLNVAVSRAKKSFLVFGDMNIFDVNSSKPSGLLAKYMFKYEKNEIKSIQPFLDDLAEENEVERISNIEGHLNVLIGSFKNAKNNIIICSPFISKYTLYYNELLKMIKECKNRGIDISVYTDEKLDFQSESRKSNSLEGRRLLVENGVNLKVLKRIHNKTLIVDNRIIVEGSFNWFSAVRDEKSSYCNYEVSLKYMGKNVEEMCIKAQNELEKMI
ncbi:MAG: hypothetical protein JW924_04970 [Fusobacteriaceae bacterium]|nr:hypothetical protein [Fusobacteriaceae bacterium]